MPLSANIIWPPKLCYITKYYFKYYYCRNDECQRQFLKFCAQLKTCQHYIHHCSSLPGTAPWLFQAFFWTEHLWPSAGAYAAAGQSGSCITRAFLQHGASSLREGESCPVWICDQTDSSHNQLTGQAAPCATHTHTNPPHLEQPQQPCGQWTQPQSLTVSPSLLARPARDWHRVGRENEKKKLECQPYDGWKEHQSQQLAGHCFFFFLFFKGGEESVGVHM